MLFAVVGSVTELDLWSFYLFFFLKYYLAITDEDVVLSTFEIRRISDFFLTSGVPTRRDWLKVWAVAKLPAINQSRTEECWGRGSEKLPLGCCSSFLC